LQGAVRRAPPLLLNVASLQRVAFARNVISPAGCVILSAARRSLAVVGGDNLPRATSRLGSTPG